MSVQAERHVEEEPPSRRAQRVVGKASQYLLNSLLAAPILLFPIALVYKLMMEHFYP